MRWNGARRSSNIEDRRGMSGGRLAVGGGIGTLLIVLIASFLGVDPGQILPQGGAPQAGVEAGGPVQESSREAEINQTVGYVLSDTEQTWSEIFRASGYQYRAPTLVLYRGGTQAGCGYAQSAVGPFYCPADQKLYIDLGFFDDLATRFGAPGDFAQAYVVAHEVGHHVQNLVGLADQVRQAQQRAGQAGANALSVRMELQADCYAGVWAYHAATERNRLEEGEVAEGLRAAAAVGDDALQRQAQGYVVPESFTHGTSEQRQQWFMRGFQTGDEDQCDTFAGALR